MKFLKKHLKEGAVCPFCGECDITGECVDIQGVRAVQDCQCQHCDREWQDTYVLASTMEYENNDEK